MASELGEHVLKAVSEGVEHVNARIPSRGPDGIASLNAVKHSLSFAQAPVGSLGGDPARHSGHAGGCRVAWSAGHPGAAGRGSFDGRDSRLANGLDAEGERA